MSDHRASSGVRNLRAMFENQGAPSPEPRGRSPAGSGPSDTNRPTSKVRASFVSVEPPGPVLPKDLGTSKGMSDNSPSAHRRESFSVGQDHGDDTVEELKKVVSEEKEERMNSPLVSEPVPEQAVVSRESSIPPPPIRDPTTSEAPAVPGSSIKPSDISELERTEESLEANIEEPAIEAAPEPESIPAPAADEVNVAPVLGDTPGDNPDKVVSGVQDAEAELKPADPKDAAAVSGGEALPPPTEPLPPTIIEKPAPQATKETPPKPPAATTATTSTPKAKSHGSTGSATTNGNPVSKKPSAISSSKDSKPSSSKAPMVKSPGNAKLPKSPLTPKAAAAPIKAKSPVLAPKEPTKGPATKPSRTSLRPSTSSTAAPTTGAASKVKASVREGTRPTSTKPTAAPAKPTATSKESVQTSPFRKPRPRSPTRPVRLPSHLIAPTASSAAKHDEDGSQKLARKPSAASRPAATSKPAPPARKQPSRASLAPSQPAKRPASRASTAGAPDESFLARMMRPTASSASKTNEKPVTSPPRRGPSIKAPSRPKPAENLATKAKQKATEGLGKVKGAITMNGNGERDHHTEETTSQTQISTKNGPAHEAPQQEPAQVEREATPMQHEQTDSSNASALLETPNFERETIR